MKYVIPVLSLIISVIALAVALPRPNSLGIDYLGVIVAIISLATAFAVGFQIWNALSLEKRLQELKAKIEAENTTKITSLEEKLTADLNEKSEELSSMISHESFLSMGIIALSNGKFDYSFYNFIRALEIENKSNKKMGDKVTFSISSLIDTDFNVKITDKEDQEYIIKTIIESGNKELIEKIGEIKSKIFSSEN